MRVTLICCLSLAFPLTASATTYYVGGVGSDTASGLSPQTPFRTLQHAADLTQPGDFVYALNGVYSLPSSNLTGVVLSINRGGSPERWITYTALPGQTPTILTHGWNAIEFGPKASYIEVNGFTITGNNDRIDPASAIKRANVSHPAPNPAYDGNCIAADGRKGTPTERPHHLRILNNTISKCGGGGIALIQSDYVTVSGNTISDCAWYSIYGTSAISTLESWNSDQSTGYKMLITRNRIFGNRELVWWESQSKITDGEAIIIDTLRSPTLGPYKGRTLIADNVIFDNGSAAVEVFRSDHVDILSNSTYANVQNPEETGRGELNLNEAGDINILDNIFYSAKGQNPVDIETPQPCTCVFGSNLYFGGPNHPNLHLLHTIASDRDLIADPLYRNLDLAHPAAVDLHVAPNSPAVDSGVTTISIDNSGSPRPKGKATDRGAYEQ